MNQKKGNLFPMWLLPLFTHAKGFCLTLGDATADVSVTARLQ